MTRNTLWQDLLGRKPGPMKVKKRGPLDEDQEVELCPYCRIHYKFLEDDCCRECEDPLDPPEDKDE